MKTKTKAIELIEKFRKYSYNGACEENDERVEHYNAKQCALICVDEIISEMEYIDENDTSISYKRFEYWHSVKEEIEGL